MMSVCAGAHFSGDILTQMAPLGPKKTISTHLLLSVHNRKLLLGQNRHDCQINILVCIIVIFVHDGIENSVGL